MGGFHAHSPTQVFAQINQTLAEQCYHAAASVYALADLSATHLLSTFPHSYYPEDEWLSDMTLGAIELSIACAQAKQGA